MAGTTANCHPQFNGRGGGLVQPYVIPQQEIVTFLEEKDVCTSSMD